MALVIKTDNDQTFSSSSSSCLMSCTLLTSEQTNVNSSKMSSAQHLLKITHRAYNENNTQEHLLNITHRAHTVINTNNDTSDIQIIQLALMHLQLLPQYTLLYTPYCRLCETIRK